MILRLEQIRLSGAIVLVLMMPSAQAYGSDFSLGSGPKDFIQNKLYVGGSLGVGKIQISGTTQKADGSFGGSAAEESANIRDKWSQFGIFVGFHSRVNGRVYVGAELDWARLSQRESFANIINNGSIYQGQKSSELIYKTDWLSQV